MGVGWCTRARAAQTMRIPDPPCPHPPSLQRPGGPRPDRPAGVYEPRPQRHGGSDGRRVPRVAADRPRILCGCGAVAGGRERGRRFLLAVTAMPSSYGCPAVLFLLCDVLILQDEVASCGLPAGGCGTWRGCIGVKQGRSPCSSRLLQSTISSPPQERSKALMQLHGEHGSKATPK